jgi:hypothetical protein
MAFMVKNPGLMPGFESLKSGDVGKRRKGMEEIVLGCWRSCIEAGDGLGAPPLRLSSDTLPGFEGGINMDSNPADKPFIADAIIANPPSFAHIHIAEKMGIPLHMMFTLVPSFWAFIRIITDGKKECHGLQHNNFLIHWPTSSHPTRM